jgi:ectoine hydroxylase-related dioxygenase (phytanoyl-CoA dioxygenase family)
MVRITEEQQRQYQEEGYFILERVIPEAHLEMLREECARFIALTDAEMDAKGVDVQGINHRGSRYFIAKRYRDSERLPEFLFSPLMAEVCRATLGPEAFLFWEQYVVKCAEVGMKFSWHQDSGYVGHDHRPYLSCWCALDDMSEENGTVYILPFSRAGVRSRQEHVRDDTGTNDLIGYHGDDLGVPVVVPAGSIAVFSSVTFHRSAANTTKGTRRVYLAQYSAEPILKKDGSGLWGLADPILRSGERVGR